LRVFRRAALALARRNRQADRCSDVDKGRHGVRAIWKGAVSFGLVSIPVKLYTATEEKDVSFHQVHREDGGRIRYKRVCQIDGEEVAYADIAKGYELPSGETVVLTDEDFADLPLTSSRVVDVLSFVPLEQVDPIYFAKSYYLEPEKNATKPYVLLRDALQQADSVALVKVAIRTREALATLRVRDGVLVLETMVWPDEVRTPDFGFLDEDVTVRPQELAMAESLIESMTGDFDPDLYHDEYREALEKVIEAKIEGREVVEQPVQEEDTGSVVDLMAALRASVAAAKKGRGEADEQAPAKKAPVRKAPAKKTAAKAPAKKAAAKKTPAKKAAAKKSA
ncbi:MAG TPA: Ku protein, partial [Nocardioidaceae bacterium]|nr:Ku protein [Nocardioidaceae bacterium]